MCARACYLFSSTFRLCGVLVSYTPCCPSVYTHIPAKKEMIVVVVVSLLFVVLSNRHYCFGGVFWWCGLRNKIANRILLYAAYTSPFAWGLSTTSSTSKTNARNKQPIRYVLQTQSYTPFDATLFISFTHLRRYRHWLRTQVKENLYAAHIWGARLVSTTLTNNPSFAIAITIHRAVLVFVRSVVRIVCCYHWGAKQKSMLFEHSVDILCVCCYTWCDQLAYEHTVRIYSNMLV